MRKNKDFNLDQFCAVTPSRILLVGSWTDKDLSAVRLNHPAVWICLLTPSYLRAFGVMRGGVVDDVFVLNPWGLIPVRDGSIDLIYYSGRMAGFDPASRPWSALSIEFFRVAAPGAPAVFSFPTYGRWFNLLPLLGFALAAHFPKWFFYSLPASFVVAIGSAGWGPAASSFNRGLFGRVRKAFSSRIFFVVRKPGLK